MHNSDLTIDLKNNNIEIKKYLTCFENRKVIFSKDSLEIKNLDQAIEIGMSVAKRILLSDSK